MSFRGLAVAFLASGIALYLFASSNLLPPGTRYLIPIFNWSALVLVGAASLCAIKAGDPRKRK